MCLRIFGSIPRNGVSDSDTLSVKSRRDSAVMSWPYAPLPMSAVLHPADFPASMSFSPSPIIHELLRSIFRSIAALINIPGLGFLHEQSIFSSGTSPS